MSSGSEPNTPQWGQAMEGAEAVLRAMAADTSGQLTRDNLGRLVLVRDLPTRPPTR